VTWILLWSKERPEGVIEILSTALTTVVLSVVVLAVLGTLGAWFEEYSRANVKDE
jgi:hypothetical protein